MSQVPVGTSIIYATRYPAGTSLCSAAANGVQPQMKCSCMHVVPCTAGCSTVTVQLVAGEGSCRRGCNAHLLLTSWSACIQPPATPTIASALQQETLIAKRLLSCDPSAGTTPPALHTPNTSSTPNLLCPVCRLQLHCAPHFPLVLLPQQDAVAGVLTGPGGVRGRHQLLL